MCHFTLLRVSKWWNIGNGKKFRFLYFSVVYHVYHVFLDLSRKLKEPVPKNISKYMSKWRAILIWFFTNIHTFIKTRKKNIFVFGNIKILYRFSFYISIYIYIYIFYIMKVRDDDKLNEIIYCNQFLKL